MKFTVESGDYKRIIDAIDFNQASMQFIRDLMELDEEVMLGSMISATCLAEEIWMSTEEVIANLRAKPKTELTLV